MARWTKDRIYRRELEKLLDDGMDERKAERLASERTEEIFGDMCDAAYEQARDRRMERDL
jgi:hypothetical protein